MELQRGPQNGPPTGPPNKHWHNHLDEITSLIGRILRGTFKVTPKRTFYGTLDKTRLLPAREISWPKSGTRKETSWGPPKWFQMRPVQWTMSVQSSGWDHLTWPAGPDQHEISNCHRLFTDNPSPGQEGQKSSQLYDIELKGLWRGDGCCVTLLASLDQLREEKKGYFKEHITQLVPIHSIQSSAEVKKKCFSSIASNRPWRWEGVLKFFTQTVLPWPTGEDNSHFQ